MHIGPRRDYRPPEGGGPGSAGGGGGGGGGMSIIMMVFWIINWLHPMPMCPPPHTAVPVVNGGVLSIREVRAGPPRKFACMDAQYIYIYIYIYIYGDKIRFVQTVRAHLRSSMLRHQTTWRAACLEMRQKSFSVSRWYSNRC